MSLDGFQNLGKGESSLLQLAGNVWVASSNTVAFLCKTNNNITVWLTFVPGLSAHDEHLRGFCSKSSACPPQWFTFFVKHYHRHNKTSWSVCRYETAISQDYPVNRHNRYEKTRDVPRQETLIFQNFLYFEVFFLNTCPRTDSTRRNLNISAKVCWT